jgi:hypothetical protein
MVECRDRNTCEDVKCEGADKYFIDDLGCFIEETNMSTIITSKVMKGAVEQLFDHECKKHDKCSSHSQLERWIIEELKLFIPSNTVFGLQKVLQGMGVVLDVDLDNDLEVMQAEYKKHDLFQVDTGGGCQAYRTETVEGDNHMLVTTDDGSDIPEDMNVPVCFGLYGNNDELIWSEHYSSSVEMFQDKHVQFLLNN